jgi:nucleobase:cation symporter-1, NCS1 family
MAAPDLSGTWEPGVPIREGEYGDRIIAVEPGGAEYIAESERHGRPISLFWTWNSANWEFSTLFVGALPILLFGGGFWPMVVALILGNVLGAAAVGILSTWGPRFGVPQLVQSRGAFGYFGNLLPAGLQTVTAGVGWFAVNSVGGTFALSTLIGLDFKLSLLLMVLVQVVVAFVGHNFIHQFEKIVFPYLAVVFIIAGLFVLGQANPGLGFNPKAPVAFGGPLGAFVLGIFVAFSYAAGWSPYALDYSRYLPTNTDQKAVFWSTTLGVFLPCTLLQIVGAALASMASFNPTGSPTDQFVKPLPGLLASLALLGIVIGTISANVLNIYSGAMSFLAMGVRLGGLHRQRAIVALVFGALGYFVSLGGERDAGHSYENFLLIIGYWITPYLGVVLTDYWLRRGRFHEREFYDSGHNPPAGLVAMVVGILASVPFWNQALWQGPLALAHPEWGDLSFLVGFFVAAAVYYLLARPALTRATT